VSAAVDTDEAQAAPSSPAPARKKMFIIGGIALLLLIAVGIGAWFLLRGSGDEAKETAHASSEEAAEETFVEVSAMVVNLRSADGAARLLKIRLTLVATNAEKVPIITTRLPLIIDSFQPFLRELRPEDLAGSAAIFRIKEEMLIRANTVAGPGSVKEVLIQDLIQQ
jgi:flagellar protein FliL